MIVGGYSLDLYCDNEQDDLHHNVGGSFYVGKGHYGEWKKVGSQFTGETFAGCAKQARRDGWKVDRKNNVCLCPMCNGKMKG